MREIIFKFDSGVFDSRFLLMNKDLKYRLFTPGPVPIPAQVLSIQAQPAVHHRTPVFLAAFKETLVMLKHVFKTSSDVLLSTSTGSGAMEAAIVNTLSPGDRVFCVVSGKFGERWADQCEAYGMDVVRWQVPLGEATHLLSFANALQQEEKPFKAVLTQYCETSTGVLHPIREMSAVVKRINSETLFLVDAITAIGAAELRMDEWQLDVVVAGSQKAFMLPTGLSFVALSPLAWKAYESSKCPKYYFDLKQEKLSNEKGETRFSSPVHLILGLHAVLKNWSGDGLVEQLERIHLFSRVTKDFCESMNLQCFAKHPSSSLTVVESPKGVDSEEWKQRLYEDWNIVVMGGQDSLKKKILRMGHMGDISEEDLMVALEALCVALNKIYPSFSLDELSSALTQAREKLLRLKQI